MASAPSPRCGPGTSGRPASSPSPPAAPSSPPTPGRSPSGWRSTGGPPTGRPAPTGESALDHLAAGAGGPARARGRSATRTAPDAFAHLDLVAPISIGIVRSGTWASTVPDLLVAEGRYGVLPGEPLDVARAAFEDAWRGVGERDPWLARAPGAGQLAGWGLRLRRAARRAPAARRDRRRGAAAGPDARRGSRARPTARTCGTTRRTAYRPCSSGRASCAQAHAVDESVRLDEVVACAQAYAVLALRRCGAPPQQCGRSGACGDLTRGRSSPRPGTRRRRRPRHTRQPPGRARRGGRRTS